MRDLISPFKGGTAARFSCPPSWVSFSHRVTSWPIWRAMRAASMPAGPAPTTSTFLVRKDGSMWATPSRQASGFTAQRVSWMYP